MLSLLPSSRVWRHAVLAVLCLGAVGAAASLTDRSFLARRLSLSSAYVSVTLVAVTLVLGPVEALLSGRRLPVSSYLRRDLGIWAGVTGLLHVAAGLQVHQQGGIREYFLSPGPGDALLPLRLDLFGLANHGGLLAAALLVLLLSLSNDWTLRRLGAQRWKRLQRSNYGIGVLVLAHGLAYQWLEDRTFPLILLLAAMGCAVVLLRLSAARARSIGGTG